MVDLVLLRHAAAASLGVPVRLIRATVDRAAAHGAEIVEACLVEPYSRAIPAPFAWTGVASAFERARFAEVLRRSRARPIKRVGVAGG